MLVLAGTFLCPSLNRIWGETVEMLNARDSLILSIRNLKNRRRLTVRVFATDRGHVERRHRHLGPSYGRALAPALQALRLPHPCWQQKPGQTELTSERGKNIYIRPQQVIRNFACQLRDKVRILQLLGAGWPRHVRPVLRRYGAFIAVVPCIGVSIEELHAPGSRALISF